jgi:hypothetical protein
MTKSVEQTLSFAAAVKLLASLVRKDGDSLRQTKDKVGKRLRDAGWVRFISRC